MYDLHPEIGFKPIIFTLILEVVFLGFCAVFIGLGVSEMKRRKGYARNSFLIGVGVVLALISLYMTKIFLEG